MDYHNASIPHSITLALLKFSSPHVPAKRGNLIAGIGGAGESRIKILLSMNAVGYLDLLDPEFDFDFVTWDNRGVGYSLPSARCFENALESKIWEARLGDLSGVIESADEESIGARLSGAKARGRLCEQVGGEEEEGGDVRRYMTTAYTARDVLEILKKTEDERDKLAGTKPEDTPKLQYIGLSYGTMVGLTFASLYPQYVSRMLLDGTVDPDDWTGKWQMSFLADAEPLWSSFFTDCFAAQKSCPLWRKQDSSERDIRSRVDTWLEKLRKEPAYTFGNKKARIVTHRDVRTAIVWACYVPVLLIPTLAEIIDGLMRGRDNVTLSYPFDEDNITSTCLKKDDEDLRADENYGAGTALNCGDAEDISNSTLGEFRAYLSALEEQSPMTAFFQGERRLRCLAWPSSLRPDWRFTGPFGSTGNTSAPILFVGNTLDPMVPLQNAHAMAKKFPGSVAVEERARGHCTTSAMPSPCLVNIMKSYLQDGVLPEIGTVCGKHCNVFDGSCRNSWDAGRTIGDLAQFLKN
jgi:pimeloyl-ACP methyl ester carboxylesterase